MLLIEFFETFVKLWVRYYWSIFLATLGLEGMTKLVAHCEESIGGRRMIHQENEKLVAKDAPEELVDEVDVDYAGGGKVMEVEEVGEVEQEEVGRDGEEEEGVRCEDEEEIREVEEEEGVRCEDEEEVREVEEEEEVRDGEEEEEVRDGEEEDVLRDEDEVVQDGEEEEVVRDEEEEELFCEGEEKVVRYVDGEEEEEEMVVRGDGNEEEEDSKSFLAPATSLCAGSTSVPSSATPLVDPSSPRPYPKVPPKPHFAPCDVVLPRPEVPKGPGVALRHPLLPPIVTRGIPSSASDTSFVKTPLRSDKNGTHSVPTTPLLSSSHSPQSPPPTPPPRDPQRHPSPSFPGARYTPLCGEGGVYVMVAGERVTLRRKKEKSVSSGSPKSPKEMRFREGRFLSKEEEQLKEEHVDWGMRRTEALSGSELSSLPPVTEDIAPVLRANARQLKEKRNLFRSLSFWGGRGGESSETSGGERPHPSPSSSSSSSSSSSRPLSMVFSSLTASVRKSKSKGEPRRAVKSCMYPNPEIDFSRSPVVVDSPDGTSRGIREASPREEGSTSLRATPERRERATSFGDLSSTSRRWSRSFQSFQEKRKVVRSCVFTETHDEDYLPYGCLAENSSRNTASCKDVSSSRDLPLPNEGHSSRESIASSQGSLTFRGMSSSRKDLRRTIRSWSFSPIMPDIPFEAMVPIVESQLPPPPPPLLQEAKRKRSLPHILPRPGSIPEEQLCEAINYSVIFPWRRGDPARTSGRSTPYVTTPTSNGPALADASTQSPCATSYTNDQSAAGDASADFAFGDRDATGEVKTKERVWRRSKGGNGVSRSTRKEKANSSPVFRRASLSHSEWDIRRPWSHVYSDREAAKLSQSVCRLAMTSGGEGTSQVDVVPDGGEGGPRSLPFMPASPSSTPEGMFQKFKKSLSLRLAKKAASRSESPGPRSSPVVVAPSGGSDHGSNLETSSATLPRRRGTSSSHKEEDPKPGFLFGHPLFRSSKERRRARLKDARALKCNSGDSGDSGIELVTTLGPAGSSDVTTTPRPSDGDSSNYNGHVMTASLADEGGPGHGIHHQHHAFSHQGVRRTHSDVGGAARLQEALRHYQRQYSTPQPIKLRPAHRLPQHTGSLHRSKSSMKRSKGSSHLRRSISQPLDLDKAIDLSSSLRKIQTSPSHTPPKRQRRPSAGNILNEDNTTSEDEICMSDSEDFRTDLKRSLDEEDMVVYAEALWDHVTLDVEELVFKAGDLITVVDSSDKDWWWGKIHHRTGWFPAAFVRLLVNQEDHQEPQDYQHKGPERKLSISALSQEQVRANVINEIICTERDFVKHLRDVVEGYLKQVRKRPDMFTEETISTIFGNMEALYRFQSTFLRDLEDCIDWEHPHKSCIGAVFTKNRAKFEIYSEYCNNHPSALSELQELYQDQKIVHFFEACRLLQEMIDISLDGFLLTPVQKICKYPLQLQELLKYTKSDHPDYQSVQGALEAMRDVALLVNERKRRMECLEKIASWQITVEGWEGPELLEDSSQLIYQGEVTKGHGGSWPKEVTLFLFDRQLVYCKRDLLKRNTYVYRGRLNLNTCEVVDLMDGKDTRLNATFHNAWKVHSHEKNKWYIFSCKSAVEKRKWMEAFRKERELVAADLNAKFIVSDKAKQHAKIAARNQKNRPKRPRSLWFSFGGNKKGRGSGRGLACPVQHHPV